MSRPSLIIISGPPAAGKSRLARPLARKLGLPLLQKDSVKEQIADAIGDQADVDSSKLGLAAIRVLYSTTLELIANGQSVVIEAFFHKGVAEAQILPLLEFADTCLLHVTADEPVLISRFERRMESLDRHTIHNDATRLDELRRYIAEGITAPLDLPVPIIEIDTTYGALDIEEIAFMVRDAISPEE